MKQGSNKMGGWLLHSTHYTLGLLSVYFPGRNNHSNLTSRSDRLEELRQRPYLNLLGFLCAASYLSCQEELQ